MAVSNAMQLGLGTVAAGAVAVTVVVVAPMLAPDVAAPVPEPRPAVVLQDPSAIAPAQAPEIAEIVPPAVLAPKLDTFRVEADGSAVFAGRADPDQTIGIMLNGGPLMRVDADPSGSFVAIVQLPYSDQSQAVSLIADPDGDAIASPETYLIAPIAAPPVIAEAPSVVVDDPVVAADPPESVIAAIDVPDPVAPAVSLDIPVPQPVPQAPAVLVATSDGIEVIQAPSAAPEVLSNVALDSITYDPSGDVLIAGRAAGEGFVQVYLDNQPVTTSRIVAGGNWRTDLPDIDTGIYTLRIDEVDTTGEVVSRIETPFKREEPAVVAEAFAVDTSEPEFQVAMTTVQPGTTLWAIAKDRLGAGVMFVEVFAANRDRIRDPDLIYPGQVFRIPDAVQ